MESLRALVRSFPSVLLGYSGGVDSALLAVVLRQELGKSRMVAAIGRSASYPAAQWQTAIDVAARFDIPLIEIHTHELEDANYLANQTNRCFFCKTELWNRLVPLAREHGLAIVCDGTNADDLKEHRPGKAAGDKAGVRSLLRSEEHTSELQSQSNLVCRLLLGKKKKTHTAYQGRYSSQS